jgi:hypothetical protein
MWRANLRVLDRNGEIILKCAVKNKNSFEWVALLLRILEVPDSNIDTVAGNSEQIFRGFPQFLQESVGIVP